MKLLLDTHVWLWSHLDPDRLSETVREHLTAEANELWLSPISVWEALVLIEKGRVEVDVKGAEWIRDALRVVPMRECGLTREVAFRTRDLELEHEDPADRFLAASAVVYGLTLLTADVRLLAAQQVPTLRAD